jgi:hypothetical protein
MLFVQWKAELDAVEKRKILSAGTRTLIFPVVLAVASSLYVQYLLSQPGLRFPSSHTQTHRLEVINLHFNENTVCYN